jgi:predicted ribosomally synthesized peptide with nif11-like leader
MWVYYNITWRENRTMEYKEVMNSEEAADLLDVKPFSIRAYAQRGLIPGKKLGNEWCFVRNDLLAWLRGMKLRVANLEIALTGAKGFTQRLLHDSQFKQKVESLSTHGELMAFARQEGFTFTSQELKEILKVEMDDCLAKDYNPRRAKRYQVYLKVLELNDQPVTDTMILDINAWGARIESVNPLISPGPVKLTFASLSEIQKVPISGGVVWSRFISAGNNYHAGVRFSYPLDQLHREGII